jgi:uncharacterized membrane-anchored protein YjiN (DUF445 family)
MTFVPLPQVQDAEAKQERLDRMKRVATGLLILVTMVFVTAHILTPQHPWLAIVRATAEAAMIGGLADWFAVTALFRHPLGIPIPHTAIVPTRKDKIGRSLGGFVQNNFLSRELIASKLVDMAVSQRAAQWLSDPVNARSITRHAARALSGAVQVLRDDDVHDLLDKSVMARIRTTRVAPIVGNILSLVTASNKHQELLDEALRLIDRVVHDHDEIIRTRIREESPWWVPDRVDDKIHDKIVSAIEHTLHDVSSNPSHPLRVRFDTAVHDFVERLRTSPDVIAKGEELKNDLLAHPSVRRFSSDVWTDAKAALVRYTESTDDEGLRPIERGIVSFGQAMLDDPALLAKFDAWILDGVTHIVDQYRGEVGGFIAETVSRWDPQETSRKIELAVGRDLQFIRINGTIMGAIVGLLLYLIA